MSLTAYHAKYFAHDLTRRATNGIDRLSMSLFDAAVDLNPHQIEAALFALKSPLSKGVILADEVGLGKTIEAGIVLCQLWAERKRRLLVICPASLRKQWALELGEKFNLPTRVLDSKAFRNEERKGRLPLSEKSILIMSFNYANALREELKAIAWDLVVVDEAHKLRNAYRPSNKVGQGIRWAIEDCRKLLLTATPLQNSLLELFGLSTLIDEHLFGDLNAFRAQYASAGSSITDLRQRLSEFCKRKHPMAEAISYALSQWAELNVLLSDGAVPIDNNVSEREMKRVILSRKNSLFVGNTRGGRTAVRAIATLERHVHTAAIILMGHGNRIGE
jgi:SNF2 family DNA or RNA helicase